jgi:hypothetical protein
MEPSATAIPSGSFLCSGRADVPELLWIFAVGVVEARQPMPLLRFQKRFSDEAMSRLQGRAEIKMRRLLSKLRVNFLTILRKNPYVAGG